MTDKRINLFNYARQELVSFLDELGEPAYRAQQLLKWIYQEGVLDFDKMTNISKSLRQRLQQLASLQLPSIALHQTSSDGTQKWLFKLHCGNCVETVFIPEENRGTLCVSSQIGCALNCSFCATGRQGFSRNLSTGEIITQVWLSRYALAQSNPNARITNVVMMGMGEPLLNFEAVVAAMDIMLDDYAYGLSKYRVTLSTVGVLPQLKRLAAASPVSLAVSLHAPNNELRNQLVPLNKKYPLEELLETCRHYFHNESRRKIFFEYVMLRGINDDVKQARLLTKCLQGIPAKLNLIPFNPIPGIDYQSSAEEQIDAFRNITRKAGIHTTIRKPRGRDILAACGNLKGQFEKRERLIRQSL